MEHKIKAQMLGNFSMEYDGKPLASDRMHRDGQFTRMMQVILHFSETIARISVSLISLVRSISARICSLSF